MTNSSLLVSGAAPVAAAVAVVAATPLWELLSGHHYPLLPGSGLSNGSSSSSSPSSNSSGSSGGAYSNSTPRAYRTATFRDGGGGGGGGGGDPGGEEAVGDDLGSCHDWQAAQHTLFQLANLCVAVSFLTTASFRFHVLFLRCILLLAFLLFLLWAGLFICMPDVLGWNLVFFLLNGAHIAWLVYRHLPSRLPLSHCAIYAKVSYQQIGWLLGCWFGWFVGWLVSRRVGFRWFVGWLVCWLVSWMVSRIVVWLVGWVIGWLVAWLVSWLVAWVVGSLVGWLIA